VRIFKMLWTTAYHDPATGLNTMEYRLECEAYWGATNATEAQEGYDRGAGGLPRRWRATTNETETEALEGLAVSGSFPCCSSSPHLHALLPLSRALCRSHALLTPQVSGSGCNDALMGYAILSLVPSINNVSLFVVTLLQLVFRRVGVVVRLHTHRPLQSKGVPPPHMRLHTCVACTLLLSRSSGATSTRRPRAR